LLLQYFVATLLKFCFGSPQQPYHCTLLGKFCRQARPMPEPPPVTKAECVFLFMLCSTVASAD